MQDRVGAAVHEGEIRGAITVDAPPEAALALTLCDRHIQDMPDAVSPGEQLLLRRLAGGAEVVVSPWKTRRAVGRMLDLQGCG
ncbi:hypothetical protein PCAR4_20028 [Paraburkholderia caribensis]|nr:hypothetical protein PCAR4_20028 [Paraburkholderia caribensis]